jgi:hypothetical protein
MYYDGWVILNDGFFAELFDSLEDLPLRFVSGTCSFLLDKTYYTYLYKQYPYVCINSLSHPCYIIYSKQLKKLFCNSVIFEYE